MGVGIRSHPNPPLKSESHKLNGFQKKTKKEKNKEGRKKRHTSKRWSLAGDWV